MVLLQVTTESDKDRVRRREREGGREEIETDRQTKREGERRVRNRKQCRVVPKRSAGGKRNGFV